LPDHFYNFFAHHTSIIEAADPWWRGEWLGAEGMKGWPVDIFKGWDGPF
jgi:hypothetical protein